VRGSGNIHWRFRTLVAGRVTLDEPPVVAQKSGSVDRRHAERILPLLDSAAGSNA
jgi:hypothetical protein